MEGKSSKPKLEFGPRFIFCQLPEYTKFAVLIEQ